MKSIDKSKYESYSIATGVYRWAKVKHLEIFKPHIVMNCSHRWEWKNFSYAEYVDKYSKELHYVDKLPDVHLHVQIF